MIGTFSEKCGHPIDIDSNGRCIHCKNNKAAMSGWQGDFNPEPRATDQIVFGIERGQLPSNVVAATPLYIEAQKGWLCPRCAAVNAPWVPKCDCKAKESGGALRTRI